MSELAPDSAVDRERFLREGKTAASINHPYTVYVYRTEEIEGSQTIAMELVDGGTLDEKVLHQGPLAVPEAVHDILQVIDGALMGMAAYFALRTPERSLAERLSGTIVVPE